MLFKWMKKIRPRLLSSVILLFICTSVMVSCRIISEALIESYAHIYLLDNNINNFTPYKRHYKFYNHCSEKQIQVIGSSITALGTPQSPNSNLMLQSAHYDNHFGVNIMGERSGRYICFNRKSKLITRFSGASPRCIFTEETSLDNMYSVLRSVFNPEWRIGFNKRGKPISGSNYKKIHRSRCYYFTKRGHNYLNHFYKNDQPGPKIGNPNKLSHHLWNDTRTYKINTRTIDVT